MFFIVYRFIFLRQSQFFFRRHILQYISPKYGDLASVMQHFLEMKMMLNNI